MKTLAYYALVAVLLALSTARADDPQEAPREDPVTTEVITLWGDPAPGSEGYDQPEEVEERGTPERANGWLTGGATPTLTVYVAPENRRSGAAVVVCPGGGYTGLAIDKEGHELARWFAERGVTGATLKYRCGGGAHQHPVPLADAQRALRLMRSKAEDWGVDADKIGIAGFSAGGHLASSAATHYDDVLKIDDPLRGDVSAKPDFQVLVYPVISMDADITNGGSRQRLLGDEPPQELVDRLSNELQVTEATPPALLVHASDDMGVPVENSLRFYGALRAAGVDAELHVYRRGGHGFGFFRGERPADRWPEVLAAWMRDRGLME
ncbi:MAG: alpha/beta hydrolase [Planctomycetota bacterium]